MQENILNNSQPEQREFDVIVTGGDIAGSIIAFWCCVNGLRVAVIKEGDLQRESIYSWSHLLPQSILSLPESRNEADITLAFRNMAPYLSLPQKVIYTESSLFSNLIFSLHNVYLKKENLSKVAKLSINCREQQIRFKNKNRKKAWVAQEYCMDVTRYTMGFIRAARAEGAEVLVGCEQLKQERIREEIILKGIYRGKDFSCRTKCLIYSKIWPSDVIARFDLPPAENEFLNPVRVEKKDLSMLFFREKERWAVRLECTSAIQNESRIEQEIRKVFPRAENLEFSPEGLSCRNYRFFDQVLLKFLDGYNKIKALFPLYSDIKIDDVRIPGGSIEYNNLWQSVSEYCDSRYDEAKETNICADDFRKLFFRYGSEIENMIERAYELMNETRDPQIIWKTVEDEFLEKNEWVDRK